MYIARVEDESVQGMIETVQKRAALVVVLMAFLPLTVGAQGEKPDVQAEAWALTDLESGKYLAGQDASERLPMASTTKIMVALVVLERDIELDETVTISSQAATFARPPYSNVGLREGDRVTVRELLEAALIPSGSSAAYALAEYAGGSSVERFVGRMNDKAEEMGLQDTHFENPIGLDADEHYSSARDLAAMTRAALEYRAFREIVSTRGTTIEVGDRQIQLESTNDLLPAYPPAVGVKTGTTPAAGPSLVSAASKQDESYVAVVLDAPQRFAASERILGYGFSHYDRRVLIEKGEPYASAPLPYRRNQQVGLVAQKEVSGLLETSEEAERRAQIDENLPSSAEAGERLGRISVSAGGERVGESPLVAREGYEEASIWQRIWYTAEGIFRGEKETST